MRVSKLFSAIFVGLGLLGFQQSAMAASCNPTVSITSTVSNLNFGTWQKPASSATATVSSSGATSGTGTQLFGPASAGNYTISKIAGSETLCSQVIFSIDPPANCGTGCTLDTFKGSWDGGAEVDFPITSSVFPGAAGRTLKVGATAAYDSTVPATSNSPAYTINVHYSNSSGADSDLTPTATIGFETPVSFNKNSDINFGTVRAGVASTYTITTAGAVSATGSGASLFGATSAGNITVVGSTTQGITISAGGFTAQGGVTPQNAKCAYNRGAPGSCSITGVAPGAGKTLLLGVDAVVDGTQAAGTTATPSFTVTVNYQ